MVYLDHIIGPRGLARISSSKDTPQNATGQFPLPYALNSAFTLSLRADDLDFFIRPRFRCPAFGIVEDPFFPVPPWQGS